MRKQTPDAHNARRLHATPHGVPQQRGSKTASLLATINREAAKHREGDRIRHIAADRTGGIDNSQSARCKAIIAQHLAIQRHDIRARRAADVIGAGALAQPLVKARDATGKIRKIMLGFEQLRGGKCHGRQGSGALIRRA